MRPLYSIAISTRQLSAVPNSKLEFYVLVCCGISFSCMIKYITLLINFITAFPQILTGPVDNTVNVLKNATFTCIAYAYPAPFIKWYRQLKNGSLEFLNDTSKYSTTLSLGLDNSSSQLTVMNVRISVSGEEFLCQATNGFTSVASNAATLTVSSELDFHSVYT